MSLNGTTYIPGFIPNLDSEGSVFVNTHSDTDVVEGRIPGHFLFNLPARNSLIDIATAPTAIWYGGRQGSPYSGAYPGFPSFSDPAETFTLTSSSANDTAAGTGARVVRIYYMNAAREIIDSNDKLIYEDVVMNGLGGATTAATGYRIWRASVISAGSSRTNEGDITINWTTTTTAVFSVMPATGSVTQLSNFSCPPGFRAYLKWNYLALNDKNANAASVYLQLATGTGTVDYKTRYITVSNGKDADRDYRGGLELPATSDLVWVVDSVLNNGADVSLEYQLLLVRDPV